MCLAFDYKLAFCLFYALFVVPWEIQFLSLTFFTMFLCYKNIVWPPGKYNFLDLC